MSEEFFDIHDDQQRLNQSDQSQQGASHQDVIEQLRQRIRELEGIVHTQNAELQDKDLLNRNYEATTEAVMRERAKKEVIEEDREKLFKEKTFFQQQAEGYVKDIDTYKERLEDTKRQVLFIRDDAEKKIKGLEKAVCYWKEQYEHILKGTRVQNSRLSKATNLDDGFQATSNILNSQAKRRRHTFKQTPTDLPRCRNCLTVFDKLQPHEIQCRFHRLGPQPWKTWKKQIGDIKLQLDNASTQGYMYWPCCGHVGLKEPPGCLKLRAHDLSNVDDV